MGGKIHSWYLTMGRYHAVLIAEFPNDEYLRRVLPVRGGARQRDHTNAEGEYRKILGSLA
jgi:uncharacterized protein with GYD domain